MSTRVSLSRKEAFMHFLKNDELDISVRWLIRRDLLEAIAIENNSFEDPIDEQEMIDLLRQRNIAGVVAEKDSLILGFMIYELNKSSFHLAHLAVAKECRRAKIGSKLVQYLEQKLSCNRRYLIVVNVPETNLGAQLFFKSLGFKASYIDYRLPEPEYQMIYEVSKDYFKELSLMEILEKRNGISL